jgi:hypothetical protein
VAEWSSAYGVRLLTDRSRVRISTTQVSENIFIIIIKYFNKENLVPGGFSTGIRSIKLIKKKININSQDANQDYNNS